MATVYLADDLKHERKVALNVPALFTLVRTRGLSMRRFPSLPTYVRHGARKELE